MSWIDGSFEIASKIGASPVEGLKTGVPGILGSIHSPLMKSGQGVREGLGREGIHPRDRASDCLTNSSPDHSPSLLTVFVAAAAFWAALRAVWRCTRSAWVVK